MPPPINLTRQGWDVTLQTGNLTFGMPLAVVPGEVPVPVAFGLNASFLANAWWTKVYDPDLGKSVPIVNEIDRPIVGGVHFGYISDAATYSGTTVPGLTVLEDGNQIADTSWTAFSSNTTLGTTLNLPQAYSFAPVSTSTAKVDPSATYLTYSASADGLGATYKPIVQNLVLSGFGTPGTTYKLVMDKNKARVFAYATTVHAWVPILWTDRFGHYVTFQWVRSTTSLPTGITAITKVTAMNQHAKGVVLRWADYVPTTNARDILRLDFVGMNAPSVLVKGYPGYTQVAPAGGNNWIDADNQWIVVPSIIGSSCRPTVISVGTYSQIDQPIWGGTGSTASVAPVAPVADNTLPAATKTWSFVYDINQAELASLTDPRGLTTAFSYTNYNIGFSRLRCVSRVDAVDSSSNKMSKQWTRTFPADVTIPQTVKVEGWWDPNQMPTPDRYHFFTFPTTNTLPYSNGVYQIDALKDTSNKTWSSTTYAFLPTGGGLDASQASVKSVTVTQDGAPTTITALSYPTPSNLQVIKQDVSVVGVGGTPKLVSSTTSTYGSRWDMLEGNQLTKIVTTRYDSNEVALLPSVTLQNVYDSPTSGPALLQLQKSYLDGGTDGTLGQAFTYDKPDGRLSTLSNVASFSPDAVATTTLTYGSDGYPKGLTTAYSQPANQTGGATVSQSATPDAAGHALTRTDVLGVITTFTYDIMGRVCSASRQGEPTTTYGYDAPNTLTRTITQGILVISELTDGFGRLVRRTYPDGRKEEPTYDAYSRTVAQRMYDTTGSASQTSTVNYDCLDRPTLSTSAGGASLSKSYALSTDGTLALVTSNVAGVNIGRSEYRNVLGQVVQVGEPTGGTTTMLYDGAGNLLKVTTKDSDQNTQERLFSYNGLGLMASKRDPETGLQTFKDFNALGLPKTVTEASGTTEARIRTILHDGLGRACKMTSLAGNDTVENFFDGALLTKATGGGTSPVTMDFTYKPATEGRLLASESTTLGSVTDTLTYDYISGTNRLNTITYPGERIVGYLYDDYGRISGIQDRTGSVPKPIVSTIDINEWGQLKRLTFGSGAYSDWSTQAVGTQLKDWTISFTTGGLGDPANPRTHTYDTAERLNQAGEWQTILHDGANRLAHAEAPALGVTSVDVNHDVFGNNISQQMSGTSASTFNSFGFNPLAGSSTTPGNQLPTTTTTGGLTGWVLRKTGEASQIGTGTSSGKTMALGWDALGRLKTLAAAGLAQTYTYAPSGIRIRVVDTTTPANNRRYLYTSGGLLMSEFTGSTPVWKRNVVYMGSEPVAEIDAAGIHELHKDHLGTPRIVTKGSDGTIEGKQSFGAFGESISGQSVGYKPLTGYTGHLQSETSGLIFMRGRFYSPAWHRFLNSDQGMDPNSWNQMAYVGGSPFMATDPSGMKTVQGCYWLVWTHCIGVGGNWTCTSEVVGEIGNCSAQALPPKEAKVDPLCAKLKALGLSGKDLAKMQAAFASMNNGIATPSGAFEAGYFQDANGTTYTGQINQNAPPAQHDTRTYYTSLAYPTMTSFPTSGPSTPYSFHGHFFGYGEDRQYFNTNTASGKDMALYNNSWFNGVNRFIGTPDRLFYVNETSPKNGNGGANGTTLANGDWTKVKCP